MKTLVIADRRPDIPLYDFIHQNQIELIITLGDLTREDILDLSRVNHIPKIGVYGNHDSGSYMPELGIMDMHLKLWDYRGLRFGGFQGCVRYKNNPEAIMYTQDQASQMLKGLPRVDVFLCHCPPRGINDEDEVAHQGFEGLRVYLDREQPKVLLHGHTYPTEKERVRQYGATRIEYVLGYRVISLPE